MFSTRDSVVEKKKTDKQRADCRDIIHTDSLALRLTSLFYAPILCIMDDILTVT